MKIEQQDIRAALRGFLELLESTDKQASIEILELWLGQLAFLQHFVDDVPVESDLSARAVRRPLYWRKLIGEQFSGLSHPTISANDPVDDLVKIAEEISECLWRWEHIDANHGLRYFRFSYQVGWGTHLRNLQTHLHDLH